MKFFAIFCFVFALSIVVRAAKKTRNFKKLVKVGEPFPGLKRGSISEVIPQREAGTPQARIVSGNLANEKQIPFQVALLIGFESTATTNVYGFCGGTLINNEWIVSAAHCISGSVSVQVRLGGIYRDSPRRTSMGVKNFVHPGWASNGDDIALVKMQRVDYDDYIAPASLPPQSSQYSEYVGQKAVASGWGAIDDNGTGSDRLRYTPMPIIDKEACAAIYGSNAKKPHILCTTTKDTGGTCSGDSGGPLVLENSRTLVGVVAFAAANGCTKGLPDGFSRITYYLDWIKQVSGISG